MSDSSIVDAGNGPDEDGIHFYNMSGTSSITNTTINCTVAVPNTTGGDDHLNLQMQSGTLNLTISNGSATNATRVNQAPTIGIVRFDIIALVARV